MCRLKQQALLACTISIFLLIITTGLASAQDVPSHTQVSPVPSQGFDFPAQLTFFASLATDSNGIIANVTQGNFSNARALLGDYNRTIDDLNASAPNAQGGTVMDAVKASRDDFATFIKDAQRYNDLYVNETGLPPAAARSNGSIANALEMKALSATLKGLQSTIEGRNADIYGLSLNNGLDLSQYGNSTVLFNVYTKQVVIRTTAPGTHLAFATYAPVNAPYNPAQSPNLNFSVEKVPVTNTLSFLSGSIALGSDLQARGQLTTQNGPVTNATVALAVGGTDAAHTQTDQNGTYAFSVPATGYYLPSVLSGTTVSVSYTHLTLPTNRE